MPITSSSDTVSIIYPLSNVLCRWPRYVHSTTYDIYIYTLYVHSALYPLYINLKIGLNNSNLNVSINNIIVSPSKWWCIHYPSNTSMIYPLMIYPWYIHWIYIQRVGTERTEAWLPYRRASSRPYHAWRRLSCATTCCRIGALGILQPNGDPAAVVTSNVGIAMS